ncbi:MAG TPA: tetratricopeptide repeat protein [Burkholderiales bacterium]|nr:tetratricopeptide repeat protein [Burkholderiales bacterium]
MLKGLLASVIGGRSRRDADRASVRSLLEEGAQHARAERMIDAERCFLETLRREPANPDALNLLGLLAHRRTHYDAAAAYFRDALESAGDVAEFRANLGMALEGLGRLGEAEQAYRRAIALAPDEPRYRLMLLFLLGQDGATSPEQLLAEHRRFAEALVDRVPQVSFPADRFDPERRLRVAYVSGDFRAHAIAFFIEPLLAARDRAAFEIFCYHTLRGADERTAEFRALADHWHDVSSLDDGAFAALVRAHEIDILVDLAGLTTGNRLFALARRLAPVQVSYLGYLATTGAKAIDYRITDALADPPGAADAWYVEKLVRLPRSFWCFAPLARMPAPLEREPADASPIVFGSFNRLTKVRPELLRLWGRLLAQVSGSELWVLDVPSDDAHARVVAGIAAAGVAANRVKTWNRLPPDAYWDRIRRADIALDTFPYNGGATTCECLWLGVPVVTKAGAMGFARSATSILGNVGLTELVAQSDEDYLAIAAALATDRPRLRALQRGLRDRMRASPLLDAPAFMRDLEEAYRELWRRACADQRARE